MVGMCSERSWNLYEGSKCWWASREGAGDRAFLSLAPSLLGLPEVKPTGTLASPFPGSLALASGCRELTQRTVSAQCPVRPSKCCPRGQQSDGATRASVFLTCKPGMVPEGHLPLLSTLAVGRAEGLTSLGSEGLDGGGAT